MFRFAKPMPKPSQQEQQTKEAAAMKAGEDFTSAWVAEIRDACNAHLLHLATFVQEAWDEAERTRDFQTVIGAYLGSVQGTEEVANKIFAPYEDKAKELQVPELLTYTRIRRLQHLLQLRCYFEYRLSINIVPAGEARERFRGNLAQLLSPELSEQF
jgi:hypothetical protein